MMRILWHWLLPVLVLLAIIFCSIDVATPVYASKTFGKTKVHTNHLSSATSKKLEKKFKEAEAFVRQNNFNRQFCFLIDMSLSSGQNRFFVYSFEKKTIVSSGLVAHGRCNEDWLLGRKYGNSLGCGCSSLGKYRIGHSYFGRFGLAYKLHGLESTNDKAFERFVVLHSHACVPEIATENEICQSDGCPTVSPGYLKTLRNLQSSCKQSTLLWIFE